MKLNQRILLAIAGCAIAVCSSGCYTLPEPSPSPDDPVKPMPLPTYGDYIFRGQLYSPRIGVLAVGGNTKLAAQVQKSLDENIQMTNLAPALPGIECDLFLRFRTQIHEMTPKPKYRGYVETLFALGLSDGTNLVEPWTLKNYSDMAHADQDVALQVMSSGLKKGLDDWTRQTFLPMVNKCFAVEVVRVKVGLDLIRIFKSDIRDKQLELDARFKNAKHVYSYRLIESDEQNGFISFRVFYRRDKYPKGMVPLVNETFKGVFEKFIDYLSK